MSDIPPKSSGEHLDPQDTEEPPIRRRGIRAGKSAKRKRDASIRNALLFTDITDSALIPVGASFVHLSRLDTAVFQFRVRARNRQGRRGDTGNTRTGCCIVFICKASIASYPYFDSYSEDQRSLPSPQPEAAVKEVPQPKIKKTPLPSPSPKAVAKEVPQPKVAKATVPPAAFQRLRPQGSQLTAPVQERLAPHPPSKAKARPTSATSASSSSAYPSSAPHQERDEAAPVVPPAAPVRDP